MTSTRKAKNARSWSEGWMRVFLETAVDAIIVIDSKGMIESFNPAAEGMFGYRDLDVVGRNVSMLMPNPYASEHDGYVRDFLRAGKKKIIGLGREVAARRMDGSVFPIHLSVAELELNGQVRFTGIIRDLTADREARAREVDTARIIETSLNEIFLFDAETLRFLQANLGARSNLGYSLEELQALTPVDIKPGFTESSLRELLQPLRDGKRANLTFKARHLRKNRSTYPVEVHLQLSAFAGRPAFVSITLDTTERDALQKALLHAQKLEAIGQLAGALAHDFNNLLMGVMSGCRMLVPLMHDMHDKEARKLVAEIQREIHGGRAITKQLLEFSRKQALETRPCDLGVIVQRGERMYRKLLGESIELRVSLAPREWTVLADPGKVEQILMNLVVNARGAMPDGGRVDIEVSQVHIATKTPLLGAGPHVLLSVSDSGCGMDEQTQSRIFEPFFTTKAPGKGTGLGLSTVFGLTREFGGSVEVESAPGEGSTFRLTFPLVDERVGPARTEPSGSVPGGTETILVVEDNRLARAGIRHVLSRLGYLVFDAADGKDALEILTGLSRVDLLLTDIVMPGMSGSDLAQAAKGTHPELRVLFMSAMPNETLVEQGKIEAGAAFLEKPFEEEELARAIREVLSKTRSG